MSNNIQNNLNNENDFNQRDQSYDSGNLQRACILCKEIPESIICLSCSHCLCLICSTNLIFSEPEPKQTELKCIDCGQITLQSEEIQEAFEELFTYSELNINNVLEQKKTYSDKFMTQRNEIPQSIILNKNNELTEAVHQNEVQNEQIY